MSDALRLAIGTLTIVRVNAPRQINRRVASRAMLVAPLVGLALGVVAELVSLATRWLVIGYGDRLLVAVVGVSVLVVSTRGLHLDGLADTSDALGSGQVASGALEVMKRRDIGPFGVMAIVLVLVSQIAALYTALVLGRGTLALVGGAVVARLTIAWACRHTIPAARTNGLGATVAGTLSRWTLVAMTIAVAVLLAGMVWFDDDISYKFVANVSAALFISLLVSQLFVRHCVRRFGGVTGDVLGAACELAFLTFVVVVCFR